MYSDSQMSSEGQIHALLRITGVEPNSSYCAQSLVPSNSYTHLTISTPQRQPLPTVLNIFILCKSFAHF